MCHVPIQQKLSKTVCLTTHGNLEVISMPKRSCSCSRRVLTCPNSVCCILPMEPCASVSNLLEWLSHSYHLALSWCQQPVLSVTALCHIGVCRRFYQFRRRTSSVQLCPRHVYIWQVQRQMSPNQFEHQWQSKWLFVAHQLQ